MCFRTDVSSSLDPPHSIIRPRASQIDLQDWTDVLDRLDMYLEKAVCDTFRDDALTLIVLRALTVLVGNSSNPSVFNSQEHLLALLAHDNAHIAHRAMSLFDTLFRHSECRFNELLDRSLFKERVFALASGFVAPERVDSIRQLCADELPPETAAVLRSRVLHFRFTRDVVEGDGKDGGTPPPNPSPSSTREGIIDLSCVVPTDAGPAATAAAKRTIDSLAQRYGVPKRSLFALRHHVRFAQRFNDAKTRQLYVKLKLGAINLAMSLNWAKKDFVKKHLRAAPEIVEMLLDVLANRHAVPLGVTIHTLGCLKRLSGVSFVETRMRDLKVLTDGVIPSMLHQCSTRLKADATSGKDLLLSSALLSFVHKVASDVDRVFSLVPQRARLRGFLDQTLALLSNAKLTCASVLVRALRVVERLVAARQAAFGDAGEWYRARFHEAGGFESCLARIEQFYTGGEPLAAMTEVVLLGDDAKVVPAGALYHKLIKCLLQTMGVSARYHHSPLRSDALKDGSIVRIIKELWTLAIGPPPPPPPGSRKRRRKSSKSSQRSRPGKREARSGGGKTGDGDAKAQPPSDNGATLTRSPPSCGLLGEKVYALTSKLLCNVIQNKPSCLRVLHAAGITRAFLDSLRPDLLFSDDVVKTVPETVRSLSLNPDALKAVLRKNPLRMLFDLVASPDPRARQVLTPGSPRTVYFLARSFEELFRHCPAFLKPGLRYARGMMDGLTKGVLSPSWTGNEDEKKTNPTRLACIEDASRLLDVLFRQFASQAVSFGGAKIIAHAVSTAILKHHLPAEIEAACNPLITPLSNLINNSIRRSGRISRAADEVVAEINAVLSTRAVTRRDQTFMLWTPERARNGSLLGDLKAMCALNFHFSVLLGLSGQALGGMTSSTFSFEELFNNLCDIVPAVLWAWARGSINHPTWKVKASQRQQQSHRRVLDRMPQRWIRRAQRTAGIERKNAAEVDAAEAGSQPQQQDGGDEKQQSSRSKRNEKNGSSSGLQDAANDDDKESFCVSQQCAGDLYEGLSRLLLRLINQTASLTSGRRAAATKLAGCALARIVQYRPQSAGGPAPLTPAILDVAISSVRLCSSVLFSLKHKKDITLAVYKHFVASGGGVWLLKALEWCLAEMATADQRKSAPRTKGPAKKRSRRRATASAASSAASSAAASSSESVLKDPWGVAVPPTAEPVPHSSVLRLLTCIAKFTARLSTWEPDAPLCQRLVARGWERPFFTNGPLDFVEAVVRTTRQLLSGAGAHGDGDMRKLLEIGFTKSQSVSALRRSANLRQAMDWLLTNADEGHATGEGEAGISNAPPTPLSRFQTQGFAQPLLDRLAQSARVATLRTRMPAESSHNRFVECAGAFLATMCLLDDQKKGRVWRRKAILADILASLSGAAAVVPALPRVRPSLPKEVTTATHSGLHVLGIVLDKDRASRPDALALGAFDTLLHCAELLATALGAFRRKKSSSPAPSAGRKRKSQDTLPESAKVPRTASGEAPNARPRRMALWRRGRAAKTKPSTARKRRRALANPVRPIAAAQSLSIILYTLNLLISPDTAALWNAKPNEKAQRSHEKAKRELKKKTKDQSKSLFFSNGTDIRASQLRRLMLLCISLTHATQDGEGLWGLWQPPLLLLLLKLTRNFTLAKLFIAKGGLRSLLASRFGKAKKVRLIAPMLLRHLVEHPSILKHSFQGEMLRQLKRWSKNESKGGRNDDAKLPLEFLVRGLDTLVLRDAGIFLAAMDASGGVEPRKAPGNRGKKNPTLNVSRAKSSLSRISSDLNRDEEKQLRRTLMTLVRALSSSAPRADKLLDSAALCNALAVLAGSHARVSDILAGSSWLSRRPLKKVSDKLSQPKTLIEGILWLACKACPPSSPASEALFINVERFLVSIVAQSPKTATVPVVAALSQHMKALVRMTPDLSRRSQMRFLAEVCSRLLLSGDSRAVAAAMSRHGVLNAVASALTWSQTDDTATAAALSAVFLRPVFRVALAILAQEHMAKGQLLSSANGEAAGGGNDAGKDDDLIDLDSQPAVINVWQRTTAGPDPRSPRSMINAIRRRAMRMAPPGSNANIQVIMSGADGANEVVSFNVLGRRRAAGRMEDDEEGVADENIDDDADDPGMGNRGGRHSRSRSRSPNRGGYGASEPPPIYINEIDPEDGLEGENRMDSDGMFSPNDVVSDEENLSDEVSDMTPMDDMDDESLFAYSGIDEDAEMIDSHASLTEDEEIDSEVEEDDSEVADSIADHHGDVTPRTQSPMNDIVVDAVVDSALDAEEASLDNANPEPAPVSSSIIPEIQIPERQPSSSTPPVQPPARVVSEPPLSPLRPERILQQNEEELSLTAIPRDQREQSARHQSSPGDGAGSSSSLSMGGPSRALQAPSASLPTYFLSRYLDMTSKFLRKIHPSSGATRYRGRERRSTVVGAEGRWLEPDETMNLNYQGVRLFSSMAAEHGLEDRGEAPPRSSSSEAVKGKPTALPKPQTPSEANAERPESTEAAERSDQPEAGAAPAGAGGERSSEAGAAAAAQAGRAETKNSAEETKDSARGAQDAKSAEAKDADAKDADAKNADDSAPSQPSAQQSASPYGNIDPEFLSAMPPEIRAEILSAQAHAAESARRGNDNGSGPASSGPARSGPASSGPASSAREGGGDEKAPPAAASSGSNEGPDPEFLAALPPELRQEAIAQHAMMHGGRSSRDSGAPAMRANSSGEMDQASILATLDPRLREDWLMQQSEEVLATLPSALLAEAMSLRRRASRSHMLRIHRDMDLFLPGLFGGRGLRMGGGFFGGPPTPRRGDERSGNPPESGTGRRPADGAATSSAPKKPTAPFNAEKWFGREGDSVVPEELPLALVSQAYISRSKETNLLQKLAEVLCRSARPRRVLLGAIMSALHSADAHKDESSSGDAKQTTPRGKREAIASPADNLWLRLRDWARTLPSRMLGEGSSAVGAPPALPPPPVVLFLFNKLLQRLLQSQSRSLLHFFFSDAREDIAACLYGQAPDAAGGPRTWLEQMFCLYLRAPFNWSSRHADCLTVFLCLLFKAREKHKSAWAVEDDAGTDTKRKEQKGTEDKDGVMKSETGGGGETPAGPEGAVQASGSAPMSTEPAPRSRAALAEIMRIPDVSAACLSAFVKTFLRENCVDHVFSAATVLARRLAESKRNREGLLREVGAEATRLVGAIDRDLSGFTARLPERMAAKSVTVVQFGGSLYRIAGRQARFLRMLSFLDSIGALRSDDDDDDKKPDEKRGKSEADVAASKPVLPAGGPSKAMPALWRTLDAYLSRLMPPKRADTTTAPQRTPKLSRTKSASSIDPKAEASSPTRGIQKRLKDMPPLPLARANSTGTAVAAELEEEESDVSQLMQLLPLIECYFLVNAPRKREHMAEERYRAFRKFTRRHGRILNLFCHKKPRLLHGSLRSLLWHPKKILDFSNKHSWFLDELRKQRSHSGRMGNTRVYVRRKRLFEDSYHQFAKLSLDELRNPMTVKFHDEAGVDAGGLTREWFLLLSRAIFNPDYCLFSAAVDNSNVFQPNKLSYVNPEHLMLFRFVGRFVGKAIYDGHLLDAYFTRSFYKHLLGVKPSVSDIESIDPEYYKSLKWMMVNPIEGVFELNFTREGEEFGVKRVYELKSGGRDIEVTDENKDEYIRLMAERMLTDDIKPQTDAFLAGFREIINAEHLSVFNEQELELLICGLPDIDIHDLRANTEYKGLRPTAQSIRWFWQIVEDMTQEEKALLVQFVTGTSKVPIQGFKELRGMNGIQRFQIHKASGKDRLPTAHTCFNQLDLPSYSSVEAMRKNILMAIREGSEGFAFR